MSLRGVNDIPRLTDEQVLDFIRELIQALHASRVQNTDSDNDTAMPNLEDALAIENRQRAVNIPRRARRQTEHSMLGVRRNSTEIDQFRQQIRGRALRLASHIDQPTAQQQETDQEMTESIENQTQAMRNWRI
jgi:hypothetical protein